MQEKGYFYLAGVISASLYLLICLSFLIYINAPKPKKYDSSKTTVLELDLISTKADKKSAAQKTPQKAEKVVKKSTSRSSKQKADFKSLFANVKTTAKKVEEKDVNAVKESLDPSRFKSKFQKQKKTDNNTVSKLLKDVKTTTNLPSNSSTSNGEEDEYFSKIKEILWQRWNPKLLESGLVVKVLVMISSSGQFDYRIMKYSNDQRFDESLKEFLESQINEQFPRPKINSKVDIIVNFKSEG
ncbi:TonB C-terminal domain-containing protein [Halarcobacter sp.]|uniref:TonB C-terminal domain-containing protein n=1 Tax=Halarcobacter sp. TaxID=2321133 RepID=UPI002AA7380C|nr:TonB C-terminal domain-containing protein [Halarcobacter sp.]